MNTSFGNLRSGPFFSPGKEILLGKAIRKESMIIVSSAHFFEIANQNYLAVYSSQYV